MRDRVTVTGLERKEVTTRKFVHTRSGASRFKVDLRGDITGFKSAGARDFIAFVISCIA